MDFCEIRLTDAPIPAPALTEAAPCGAIVDFFGVVRPIENGEPIDGIDYEFHARMAVSQLRAIVQQAAEKHPLLGCRLIHRVGFVPAGEVSLFLRVATGHREAAYPASRALVEELKRAVPIWKRPRFCSI